MANSEWVLGVHVQHFQNLYNAEIRTGNVYCCCDISYVDVPCVEDLTDLDVTACMSECEPYLEIRFKVCFADGTCSNMENEITCKDNTPSTCISPLLVQLCSSQSINGSINNVSAKKASFKPYKCICIYVYKLNGNLPK